MNAKQEVGQLRTSAYPTVPLEKGQHLESQQGDHSKESCLSATVNTGTVKVSAREAWVWPSTWYGLMQCAPIT